MSSKTSRQQIYKYCREQTGLENKEWANLFELGDEKAVQNIAKKELPFTNPLSRGVNKAEALGAQLVLFLDKLGYDLSSVQVDDEGWIQNIPKKKKKK